MSKVAISALIFLKKRLLLIPLVILGLGFLGSIHPAPKSASKIAVKTTQAPELKTVEEYLSETPTPTPIYSYPTTTPTTEPEYYYQPTPQPVYQPQHITCYTSGDYTHCSDGTSSIQSGNTTFVNGGANGNSGTCFTNGGYTNCSDGSSAINSGNVSFVHGNGTSSTCFHNGNMTTCN